VRGVTHAKSDRAAGDDLVRLDLRVQRQVVYASPGAAPSNSVGNDGRLLMYLDATPRAWIVVEMDALE
jgi:hypothetical protein